MHSVWNDGYWRPTTSPPTEPALQPDTATAGDSQPLRCVSGFGTFYRLHRLQQLHAQHRGSNLTGEITPTEICPL